MRLIHRCLVLTSLLLLLGACAAEPDTASAPSPDGAAASIARGDAWVREHACRDCHASAADGVLEGRDGGVARPGGPNLTPDVETGLGAWSDEQILGALTRGVDDEGEPLCSTMPRYALTDDVAKDVIAYLRSLAPVRSDVVPRCGRDDRRAPKRP
jgi:hypothetical protein